MQHIAALNRAADRSPAWVFGLVGAILLWGANWPVMKAGLAHVTPLWFSAMRFAAGAACRAVCILHLRHGRPAASAIALASWQMLLATLTGGRGFDVVFDTVGSANLDGSFEAAALGGRVSATAARSTHDLSPCTARRCRSTSSSC
ncbi:hypothetical protein ACFOD4_13180 [Pseudoroseomonas globiformis]|uniref:EamA domain-containing protein n=1 Tax=Teichococcus globiformis TaxID=2307229 RepID=A0ABV7G0L2_9PROT